MKKLMAVTFGLFMFAFSASAEINNKEAESFIKRLTNEGIEELVNSTEPKNIKDAKFKALFEENLDLDFVGKFVLGRYWRAASTQQKQSFLKAYKEFNIRTWSARFDEFKGRKFDFVGVKKSSKNSNQVFVNTEVDMGQSQAPVKVVWRVLQEPDGEFKVIDIIIENVSLAISARTEYVAFIKNNKDGINALIKKLESK